jgi:hypothetical protein
MVSLKDVNKLPLTLVCVANVAVYCLMAHWERLSNNEISSFVHEWASYAPPLLAAILVGIINAQFSSEGKAMIVFLKRQHPLPGSEAYSRHAMADSRINMDQLTKLVGPLPTDPQDQNSHWYRLFKSVDKVPAVSQAHREYLLCRDWAVISLLLLPAGAAIAFVSFDSYRMAWAWLALLLCQFLLVRRAAARHGVRLVQTVCALKSIGE